MVKNSPDIGAIINEFRVRRDRFPSPIDPDFFADLANEFGIPEDKRQEALKRACGAAHVYEAVKHLQVEPDGEPSFSAVRKEVLAIERQAKELANTFSKISGAAWEWLEIPERVVDMEVTANWETISESRFGHVIWRQSAETGVGSAITYLHLNQIKQAVCVLAKMAEFTIEKVRPGNRGGRPRNEALRLWVINIREMWAEVMGEPFTLDVHDGKPISKAAVFCERLMQPLDPTITFKQIATAMRNAIGTTKPGRGRRRH